MSETVKKDLPGNNKNIDSDECENDNIINSNFIKEFYSAENRKKITNTYIMNYLTKNYSDIAETFKKEAKLNYYKDFSISFLNQMIENNKIDEALSYCINHKNDFMLKVKEYNQVFNKINKEKNNENGYKNFSYSNNNNSEYTNTVKSFSTINEKYIYDINNVILYLKLIKYKDLLALEEKINSPSTDISGEETINKNRKLEFIKNNFTQDEMNILEKEIPSLLKSIFSYSRMNTNIKINIKVESPERKEIEEDDISIISKEIANFNEKFISDFFYWHDFSIENCFKTLFCNKFKMTNFIQTNYDCSKVSKFSVLNDTSFSSSNVYGSEAIVNEFNEKNNSRSIELKTFKENTMIERLIAKEYKTESIPKSFLGQIDNLNIEVSDIVLSNNKDYLAVILKNNSYNMYSVQYLYNTVYTNKSDEDYYNFNKKKVVFTFQYTFVHHTHQINSLRFNYQDTMIVTSSKDQSVKIANAITGKQLQTLNQEHDDQITSACWVGIHSNLIISSGLDKKIILWGTDSYINSKKKINSPDSYKYESFKKIKIFESDNITEMIYSIKLNVLILSAPTKNSILIYDADNCSLIQELKMEDAIVNCCLSKKDLGQKLLVNSSKSSPVLVLYKMGYKSDSKFNYNENPDKTGTINSNLVHKNKSTPEFLNEKLSEDNNKVFYIKQVRKYFGHKQESFSIKCNFGGEYEQYLTCGSEDACIYIWNILSSIPMYKFKAHSAPINCVVWTNNLLISGSDDYLLKVYSSIDDIQFIFHKSRLLKNDV